MQFDPPRNASEIFRMFTLFDSTKGIDSVLNRFNWVDVKPDQLRSAVLESCSMPPGISWDGDVARCMKELLNSREFRKDILAQFLNAFPDKKRIIFVHIPKCAGSDLTRILAQRHLVVSGTMGYQTKFLGDKLFAYLHDVMTCMPFVREIVIRGHVPLHYYIDRKLIRESDQIFTVIRDPVDRIISAVNFQVKLFLRDPLGKAAETKRWQDKLGWKRFPDLSEKEDVMRLAKQVLRNPQLIPANKICTSFGDGSIESALANIVRSNIDITDLLRYETWLQDTWRAPKSLRANRSEKVLSSSTLDADDRFIVDEKVSNDYKLYNILMDKLKSAGAPSIRGSCLRDH